MLITLLILHAIAQPIGFEAVDVEKISNIYIATSAVSGAMLGLMLATLAILLALPDREAVVVLRTFTAWPSLQYSLLATALSLALLTVISVLGLAVDGFFIRDLFLALSCASAWGVLIVGSLFSLMVIHLAQDEGGTT